MKLVEISIDSITESAWNPNQMDLETRNRLRASIRKFELVAPLVVREISPFKYETIGGAHRLYVVKELGAKTVPCVVVTASDADARLLAQALNGIEGTDDPVKRQAALELIFEKIPAGEVLELLPDAKHSIGQAISFSLPSLPEYLNGFEGARKVRLNNFSARITNDQLETIGQAVAHAKEHGPVDSENPNKRGNALFHICKAYMEAVSSPIDAHL
ncbi:MAG: ParB N-terminal domain-containing protein [Chloroflexi bacterium]|nr:ParB N-terminal domain-containing protein [Chloroflexota bacterium]